MQICTIKTGKCHYPKLCLRVTAIDRARICTLHVWLGTPNSEPLLQTTYNDCRLWRLPIPPPAIMIDIPTYRIFTYTVAFSEACVTLLLMDEQ